MNTQNNSNKMEQINELYSNHHENLSDYARGFLGDYADIESSSYICDAISNFNDNNMIN